ncbi:low affinity iron permease family protein [Streptomyces sp. HUAS TT11]|uniref:low affinity iron permease family protein n=1 Tax=Streptomyces sp. HUAS TT11 TaxID=3447508 RepID=UPI003F65A7ED
MTFQSPAERGGPRRGRFEELAEKVSNLTSSPLFFLICLALVGFFVSAHVAKLPLEWLLLAGESMTAVTLLLLALLKNSEMRAEHAVQRKLDAIARIAGNERWQRQPRHGTAQGVDPYGGGDIRHPACPALRRYAGESDSCQADRGRSCAPVSPRRGVSRHDRSGT